MLHKLTLRHYYLQRVQRHAFSRTPAPDPSKKSPKKGVGSDRRTTPDTEATEPVYCPRASFILPHSGIYPLSYEICESFNSAILNELLECKIRDRKSSSLYQHIALTSLSTRSAHPASFPTPSEALLVKAPRSRPRYGASCATPSSWWGAYPGAAACAPSRPRSPPPAAAAGAV